jgi:hypothetical protein
MTLRFNEKTDKLEPDAVFRVEPWRSIESGSCEE